MSVSLASKSIRDSIADLERGAVLSPLVTVSVTVDAESVFVAGGREGGGVDVLSVRFRPIRDKGRCAKTEFSPKNRTVSVINSVDIKTFLDKFKNILYLCNKLQR
jgi:hypothetical protein